jgi:hypothetical protein
MGSMIDPAVAVASQDAYYSRPKPPTWGRRLWLLWQGLTFQARTFKYKEARLTESFEVHGWVHKDGRVFITSFRTY